MIEVKDSNVIKHISEFISYKFSGKLKEGFFVGEKLSNLFMGEENIETDIDKNGSFFYKVKDGIKFKNFIVYTHGSETEVSYTGIIIELPTDFKSSLDV